MPTAKEIGRCDPVIPEGIYNRAADNWLPILAIADVIGGDCPGQARRAALAACSAEEQQSRSILLLGDIRDAFAAASADSMPSKNLAAHLVALEDRPWSEANHGKPLTQNGLARMLDRFGIKSKTIRCGTELPKGYAVDDLKDAFARYLSPSTKSATPHLCPNSFESATPQQSNEINDLDEKQSATLKKYE